MRLSRLVPTVAVLVVLLGHPPGAVARVVRRACRDGVLPPLAVCAKGCVPPVRCDLDDTCDATCTFTIRDCGAPFCLGQVYGVPVGHVQKVVVATAPGAKPTRFVVRCLPHPRGLPCPTTSTTTTTSTSTSVTILACPTTTTLGVPDCGGVSVCLGPCRSGQTCADVGGGQCGCTGPVLCGGTFSVCGGECPSQQTCTPLAVPDGCPSVGCTCR